MNMRVDIRQPVLELRSEWAAPSQQRIGLFRRSFRALSVRRLCFGGRIDDRGRLPRYAVLALLGVLALWVPVAAYLKLAPVRFASSVSLILPGSGASNSISLSEIGQASSYANSPYASPSLSPTVTYKRLLGSQRVLAAAAARLGEEGALDEPRVRLVALKCRDIAPDRGDRTLILGNGGMRTVRPADLLISAQGFEIGQKSGRQRFRAALRIFRRHTAHLEDHKARLIDKSHARLIERAFLTKPGRGGGQNPL
ncbi:MAG: hypothetical protein AAFY66_18495, partial [Pseudomonadota bacterium]